MCRFEVVNVVCSNEKDAQRKAKSFVGKVKNPQAKYDDKIGKWYVCLYESSFYSDCEKARKHFSSIGILAGICRNDRVTK